MARAKRKEHGEQSRIDGAPSPEIMTLNQVATFLQCERSSIYRHMKDGLPAHRLGAKGQLRFLKAEVVQWLTAQSANTEDAKDKARPAREAKAKGKAKAEAKGKGKVIDDAPMKRTTKRKG